MKNKIFNHPEYKKFSGKYIVNVDGDVIRISTLKKLTIHNYKYKNSFVRLSGEGDSITITLAKLLLLTFKSRDYKRGSIAIHLDGNIRNNSLSNLAWGTRKNQSDIAMKNPENRNRISKIGKKYGKENWKKNLIIDGRFLKHRFHSKETIEKINTMYKNGKTPTEISKILNISRSSIYNHIIVKSLKN